MIAFILEYAGLVCVQTHIFINIQPKSADSDICISFLYRTGQERLGSFYVSSLMQGGHPYFIHDGQPIDGLSC